MGSLLKSTLNTRVLVDQPKFIRSDLPWKCTKDELDFLHNQGIRLAVDLRTEGEYTQWQSSFESDSRFKVLHMPLTVIIGEQKTKEDMVQAYKRMLDNKLTEVLNTIMYADSKVIYFCYTGKDRTGVVSAMLLRRLGYPRTVIESDYMLSKLNMEQWIRSYCSKHPEEPLEVCLPTLEFLKPVLDCEVL